MKSVCVSRLAWFPAGPGCFGWSVTVMMDHRCAFVRGLVTCLRGETHRVSWEAPGTRGAARADMLVECPFKLPQHGSSAGFPGPPDRSGVVGGFSR